VFSRNLSFTCTPTRSSAIGPAFAFPAIAGTHLLLVDVLMVLIWLELCWSQSFGYHYRYLHHLLLQQNPEWFDVLVLETDH